MQTVVVTPAGRRKYLEVLAPRILRDPDVDFWELWVNTQEEKDIEWMKELHDTRGKVRLIHSDAPYNDLPLSYRIHNFYRQATDPDVVYVRLDDDICYYESGSIGKLANYRINNPHPFLVYGNVLNSGLTSYLHQQQGHVPREWGELTYSCLCDTGWKSGEFAGRLHRKFLDHPDPKLWYLPDHTLREYERHSINAVSWLGSDAKEWADKVDMDEEVWVSMTAPREYKRPCVCVGDTLFCHYSFYVQREYMDKTDILPRYKELP